MNSTFADMLFPADEAPYLSTYADDILCHSTKWSDHLTHLECVLKRCDKVGLSLKPSKCSFASYSQEFLGYVISKDGRTPDKDKIQAVASFLRPTCVSDVQKFLGIAGYYREHIPHFATSSFNLRKLLKSQSVFHWGDQEQKEFDSLKQALCLDKVLLHHPNWERNFIVQTDASSKGLGAVLSQIGAVLSQIGPDNKEHPVRYASRVLQVPESKWTTREQELLAVIWACETFHRYLWGRKFLIQTDHANLQWLQAVSPQKSRLARWAMRLAEYDFELQHRSGKNNANADAFSRCPIPLSSTSAESTSSSEMESLMDVKTLVVLKSCLDVDVDLSPENELAQDQLIALKPSLFEFRDEQRLCPELMPIIQYLTDLSPEQSPEKNSKFQGYEVNYNDGCLYYNDITDPDNRPLLVVPATLRRQFMYAHHNAPLSGGHRGRDSTLSSLRQKYYWPGMVCDVRKWVRKCIACVKRKASQVKQGLMQIRTYSEPWDTVGIDLIGPFPETKTGYKYVLTVTDFFSHYTIVAPLSDKSERTVAYNLFNHVICVHSCPKKFMSDRGTEFLNDIINELCQLLSIKKVYTSAYRPQANGGTERVHRFINDSVSMYITKFAREWDLWIYARAFVHNTSVITGTDGLTPFFLSYVWTRTGYAN
jgi:hypothetical protein